LKTGDRDVTKSVAWVVAASLATGGFALGNEITSPGSPGSDVKWVALAAPPNLARVFQSEEMNTEQEARRAARSECERKTGQTCSVTKTVPTDWDVVVLACGGSPPDIYMGGSSTGNAYGQALEFARTNGGYTSSQCKQVGSY
jgi:hypothetical protein